MTIVVNNTLSSYCPICDIKTAGITENGKSICPLCKRELWHCEFCGQKTFGTLHDEGKCGHCGKERYHSDVQPKEVEG